jgi:hypothetical protein
MGLLKDTGFGDYTVKDLLFWSVAMAVFIVVYLALAPYDVHPVLRFIAAGVVGMGVGWAVERAVFFRKPPEPPGPSGPPRA